MRDIDGAEAELARIEALARRRETEGGVVWHLWGEGPPVVLLHGAAGSWRHWVRNVERLSRHRLVIAADMPGFGASALPPVPVTMDGVAGALARGIAALLPGDARFDLVGFSLGSAIAGYVTAAMEDRVRRLVLVGAGGLTPPREIEMVRVREKEGAERMAAHRENLLRIMIHDPAAIDALALAAQAWNSDHARLRMRGVMPPMSLTRLLPALSTPADAIWGEFDQPAAGALPERTAALRALRPASRVAIIPGAGHWVAFEAAAAFEAALLQMID
ncbi:MAG TPA: alpha/beta fold hydrolase [Roseomonas sp.]|jgi:pimeloyl-ACP methyl ester carboxylesterase